MPSTPCSRGSQQSTLFLVGLASALAVTTGCDKVTKDVNDKTPPQVEIKIRNADGQYVAADKVNLSLSGSLDISCVVSDSGGVQSATLSYFGGIDTCTVGSSVFSGSFYIQPLPDVLSQTLQADSQGKVLDRLPLLSTLKGPFECSVPGQGKGAPYGQSIKVVCQGRNWSNDAQSQSAQKVLEVDF